jgi:anti-sigma B factor antagonist
MTVSVSRSSDGVYRLSISGNLDATTSGLLKQILDNTQEARPRAVEIDLSGLRIIDSTGVGVLVAFWKRLRALDTSLAFFGVRDQPLAIFKLLQLDRLIAVSYTSS